MYSYNLRGTNGSGKTRVARYLLEVSGAKPILFKGNKVRVYKGELYGTPIFVLGSYTAACGGCDTINNVSEVAELLHLMMTNNNDQLDFHISTEPGIVFFEGLMISHMLGTVGKMQANLGVSKNILAFLDTPLNKCIEHVVARRLARGDQRPFEPRNVIVDHPRVLSCRTNAINQGYTVVDVPWKTSINTVLEDLEILATNPLSFPIGRRTQ
jgi:hypothetical protein